MTWTMAARDGPMKCVALPHLFSDLGVETIRYTITSFEVLL